MQNAILATYVWKDNNNTTRSKVKVILKDVVTIDDLPTWNFDGSSTGQATGKYSDVFLKPIRIYKDPFRGGNHILVLCECWDSETTPNETNTRRELVDLMEKHGDLEPLCGIEQEFVLFDKKTKLPYKWNTHDNPGMGPQGPYYCGVGGDNAFGREISDKHLELCLLADVKIYGTNAEVMPAQWEFQIGTCDPLRCADDMTMALYLLRRVTEDYDCYINLHPKPYLGDWNGSGAHTNFSTKAMREEGGLKVIQDTIAKFEPYQKECIQSYGEFNEMRLTGDHETANVNQFLWGEGDRGASIRIPKQCVSDGKGYFEDRRPASNCDHYLVLSTILRIVGRS